MEEIMDLLNIKDPDILEKVKCRVAKKKWQFYKESEKQMSEKWCMHLVSMGIRPDYLSYKVCPIFAEVFSKAFKYIKTGKHKISKKNVFFIMSQKIEGRGIREIIDSFQYSYAIFSKFMFGASNKLYSVGHDCLSNIMEKLKSSNHFKNDSEVEIFNKILGNDVFLLIIDNSDSLSEHEKSVIEDIINKFLLTEKNLILCTDSDGKQTIAFSESLRKKIGRPNIFISKMF